MFAPRKVQSNAYCRKTGLAWRKRFSYHLAAMSYPRWTLVACTLISLALARDNQADDPQLLPRAGVLVLRTGRVLRGEISQVGDRFVVALSDRDEITLPVDKVEMRCDSLKDAYRRKRGELPPLAKVADHIQLADWCLRYDLMTEAAEQLMAAQRRDPSDPTNEHFEKRLRLAAHRRTTPASSPIPKKTIVMPAELDELVRGLPPETVEQFTNAVQPLLINRCGASRCHGSTTDSEFRLMYPHWSKTLPRRFTQQNLQTTLGLVDHDQPEQSPLLVMSTQIHGGAEKPALSENDVAQLRLLARWVFRSVVDSDSSAPAVLQAPNALLLQPLDRPTRALNQSDTAPLSTARSSARSPGRYDPLVNMAQNGVQPASHTESIQKPPVQDPETGVDPFDPEIFNRRYLKRSDKDNRR